MGDEGSGPAISSVNICDALSHDVGCLVTEVQMKHPWGEIGGRRFYENEDSTVLGRALKG